MQQSHPKRTKRCAYCNYWVGEAKLRYVSNGVGFEYDNTVRGKCIKRSGADMSAGSSCSNFYEPNIDAKKLL